MNHGMLTYGLLKCREDAHVMGHRLIREVGEDTIHMFGPTRSEERRRYLLRKSKEWLILFEAVKKKVKACGPIASQ